MNKKEETKIENIKMLILLIGFFSLAFMFLFGIQANSLSDKAQNLENALEKELEKNTMLNNQVNQEFLTNQILKQDLNSCIKQYNQLYAYANELYKQQGDVNK